jgi:hypothetical protein
MVSRSASKTLRRSFGAFDSDAERRQLARADERAKPRFGELTPVAKVAAGLG